MPNDPDADDAHLTPAPVGQQSACSWPPSAEAACDGAPQATRALVDGVGVYTASPGSPFLTAPLPSAAALVRPDSTVPHPHDALGDQLRDLREPLRRQVQGVPLRLRLSEEEVSGLVSAVLEVLARYGLASLRLAARPDR